MRIGSMASPPPKRQLCEDKPLSLGTVAEFVGHPRRGGYRGLPRLCLQGFDHVGLTSFDLHR